MVIAGREGNYQFGDRAFGCWRESGHGEMNLSSAIIECLRYLLSTRQ